MADIISHLTSSDNILMYIDSVEKNSSEYKLNGWIFATNGKIQGINTNDVKIQEPLQFTDRTDVTSFYSNITNSDIGFEISINKLDIFKPIKVKVLDKSTNELIDYEIESFAKWIAYYSGFKNTNKGVIVVDNFYKDPDFIREWAINEIKFSPSASSVPNKV